MKLALIPPLRYQAVATRTNYHLVLPQLLKHKSYKRQLEALVHKPNQHIILDNGAAEGIKTEAATMIRLGLKHKADEVVVPDVIGDHVQSTTLAQNWGMLVKHPAAVGKFKSVYVVQGSYESDLWQGVCWAAKQDFIHTIALPRNLIERFRDDKIRLKIAQRISRVFALRFQIHLLGASPLWSEEAKYASALPFIRGMDTSMPFVYAWHGIALAKTPQVRCKRPGNYFDIKFLPWQEELMWENVEVFMEWCEA